MIVTSWNRYCFFSCGYLFTEVGNQMIVFIFFIALHSLQYFSAVTERVNITFVLVDGQQMYYSSSNNSMIVAEWMKSSPRADYREGETQRISGEQSDLYHHFTKVVKLLNHTAGKNKHFYTINS